MKKQVKLNSAQFETKVVFTSKYNKEFLYMKSTYILYAGLFILIIAVLFPIILARVTR